MKIYFLYVTMLISLYACKNSADKQKDQNIKDSAITINQPTSVIAKTDITSVVDTLIIKEACAISYYADSATMSKKQKEMGENFYTAADDYAFYQSQLDSLLETKKLKIINTKKKFLKFVQPNGNNQLIDLSKEIWINYFFKPGNKPKVVDMASPEIEYKQYFGK